MLDPLLYRHGVPPVVIRCVHWTMQMGVLQTWIKVQGITIVMKVVRYNVCSHIIICCTFRLKRKNILSPTRDACCPLLALQLRSIQLMNGEPLPRYSALQLLGENGACVCAMWGVRCLVNSTGGNRTKLPSSRWRRRSRSLREVFPSSCFFATTDLSQIYNRETQRHGTPCTKTINSYLFSFLYNNPRKIRRETTVGKFVRNNGRR